MILDGANEPWVRFGAFLSVLLVLWAWEALAPRRPRRIPRRLRWGGNLGVLAVDVLVLRLAAPGAALGTAFLAEEGRWGLLPALGLPQWARLLLSVVLLDLVIYLQHVLFHILPLLWRFHRMHHSDVEFDATTGVRFHPVEILISLGIKMGAVAALGAPPLGVLLFEVLLNATSVFNHGNVRLPARLDGVLRWFVVTPEMHRVHHSVIRRETDSNFGFNLPWWDRIFGTYRPRPAKGHLGMTLGIPAFRKPEDSKLWALLVQPFCR